MELLQNPIREYAWGSRTAIATLQGRATPTPTPEAELWMGAHPDSPSLLARPVGPVTLTSLVESDPHGVLGSHALQRFGPRLPFMLKMLAADESLSLQAHPTAEQVAEAYARLGSGDGQVTYTDPYSKPELLVALTSFDALCGFRSPETSAQAFEALGVPALAHVADYLRGSEPAAALRHAIETLLRWPELERGAVVADVAAAARRVPDLAYLPELADRYPRDPGVLVTMLLNHLSLEPDDGIWMPAGNLHAYLRGSGVEVLACSDNVLRCGLTPKPVNVDELLRILDYKVLAQPLVTPVAAGPGVTTWPVPAEEFALYRVVVGGGASTTVDIDGPRIVFASAGSVQVSDGDATVKLSAGQAAFGAANRTLELAGDGVAFVATTGLDQ